MLPMGSIAQDYNTGEFFHELSLEESLWKTELAADVSRNPLTKETCCIAEFEKRCVTHAHARTRARAHTHTHQGTLSLTHTLTHSLAHPLTCAHTHSHACTHTLTHTRTHTRTHSLTDVLTHARTLSIMRAHPHPLQTLLLLILSPTHPLSCCLLILILVLNKSWLQGFNFQQ